MSGPTPGSPRWWQDTALIVAGGVALAAWLWDGSIGFYTTWVPEVGALVDDAPRGDVAADVVGDDVAGGAPKTLERPAGSGCLTSAGGEAEGMVYCFLVTPGPPPLTLQPPEEPRLFP